MAKNEMPYIGGDLLQVAQQRMLNWKAPTWRTTRAGTPRSC